MRLRIVTPLAVAVEEEGIRSLNAEDGSGRFGILPGHADFLTVLAISVASWTGADGKARHAAVRGGVLTVTGGSEVVVTTREAVLGEDLATLSETVLARFRADVEEAKSEHVDATRLHLAAIRQIVRSLAGASGHGQP